MTTEKSIFQPNFAIEIFSFAGRTMPDGRTVKNYRNTFREGSMHGTILNILNEVLSECRTKPTTGETNELTDRIMQILNNRRCDELTSDEMMRLQWTIEQWAIMMIRNCMTPKEFTEKVIKILCNNN